MHVPPLPLSAFRRLIGPDLAGQLETLRVRPGAGSGQVVLFSDLRGEALALLTVGPGRRFERLEDAAKAEIDGLRALCVLDETAVLSGEGGDTTHLADTLRTRENFIAECEEGLAEAGQRLAEREALVEQREQALLAKERDFFRRGGEAAQQ